MLLFFRAFLCFLWLFILSYQRSSVVKTPPLTFNNQPRRAGTFQQSPINNHHSILSSPRPCATAGKSAHSLRQALNLNHWELELDSSFKLRHSNLTASDAVPYIQTPAQTGPGDLFRDPNFTLTIVACQDFDIRHTFFTLGNSRVAPLTCI